MEAVIEVEQAKPVTTHPPESVALITENGKERKHNPEDAQDEIVIESEVTELEGGKDVSEPKQVISVGEQMQIMCDLYGFKQDTYWDCYRDDQKDALRNKLSLIVSHEFVTEKNLVNRL